jgi:hypothetical protein
MAVQDVLKPYGERNIAANVSLSLTVNRKRRHLMGIPLTQQALDVAGGLSGSSEWHVQSSGPLLVQFRHFIDRDSGVPCLH